MTVTSSAQAVDGPYEDSSINLIYQLLFCDRLELFKQNYTGKTAPPWSTLFEEKTDVAALMKIAEDADRESRVRMLAFNRLRALGQGVPARQYLGTIIEVRLAEGPLSVMQQEPLA